MGHKGRVPLAPGGVITMPRKLRCISLVLVVALSASITCQTVHASPLAPLSRGADLSSGDFLATVWNWFAAKVERLGSLVSPNVRQSRGALPKDTGASDPNGASANAKPCVLGVGGSLVTLQP
jgi:hypothetical protein